MSQTNRRDFLKTSGLVAGAAAVSSFVARSAHAEGSEKIKAVMIGRGMLRNPGLLGELHGQAPVSDDEIRAWLTELKEENLKAFTETPTLFKLKEIWAYLQDRYPDRKKELKQLFKSKKLYEYENAAASLFR